MNLQLLHVGHCFHPEAIITRGGSWKAQQFPAIVGLFKHPRLGHVLFDTGYAKRFLQATRPFPQRFYRWLTPMHLCDKQQLLTQLKDRGIERDDIRHIFVSHFHADHIAGLLDFPNATYICSRSGLQSMRQRTGINALIKGYLRDLMPEDFEQRVRFIEASPEYQLPVNMAPFSRAYDIFNDGSFLAIELPGHAFGHFGLLTAIGNDSVFLIGDACWTEQTLITTSRPHPLANLVLSDKYQYYDTIDRLAQLYGYNRSIRIIPSHCMNSYERFCAHYH
ncbi:MBL fold metallo-hydrolase [Gynuella sunshinyii]|uniref:Zn-dependent hydrolase, including glyoxylase n=1 Tax=Gynuella sunshinyii YC6258 TaxID=1445510 RepID=A0A0C5W516_9GAMM|nr:MBL fold metallo-hydrolase [Gynuella sunshinyii]AJQ97694.1 Zn-dependent hydrolase, including glyoxylase [Gynuella sunshinyii YC6258]